MLSARLLDNSRLLVLRFCGIKCYTWLFDCAAFDAPNPYVVQGSTVF